MRVMVLKNYMAENYYERNNYNILTDFVLPILFNKKDDIINEGYLNCYSYDYNFPWEEDKIYLIFDDDYRDENTLKIYQNIHNNKFFHSEYQFYDNGNKIKYTFAIPPKFKKDYKYILEGFYSKTSETYKLQVLDFWKKTSNSRLGGILYKKHYQQEDNIFKLNAKGELLDSPECVLYEYKQPEIKQKPLVIKN